MLPVSLLVAQKLQQLLTTGEALANQIASIAPAANIPVPVIPSTQVVLTSAGPDLSDKQVQLTYPRVCLYTDRVKNTHAEKFRTLSGTISVIAEVWASANLVQQVDQWVHYYVEATTMILRQNTGDLGDGIFFPGTYDIQFQPPKAGGFGYVESAKITCSLNVSRN